jgi:NADPH-dependent curcumin reductase CurA
MISQYNLPPQEQYPIRNLMLVVGKRLTIRGFIVGDADMGPKHAAEHQRTLQAWIADGSFKTKLSVTKGIENAGEALLGMLEGKNFGKAVLTIAELEDGGKVSFRGLDPFLAYVGSEYG